MRGNCAILWRRNVKQKTTGKQYKPMNDKRRGFSSFLSKSYPAIEKATAGGYACRLQYSVKSRL